MAEVVTFTNKITGEKRIFCLKHREGRPYVTNEEWYYGWVQGQGPNGHSYTNFEVDRYVEIQDDRPDSPFGDTYYVYWRYEP